MTLPLPPFELPYYAAIFAFTLSTDDNGYDERAGELVKLVQAQNGFLGFEAVQGPDRFGILVSYWRNEEDVAAWHEQADHADAQSEGRKRWYEGVTVHVAKVERAYGFTQPGTHD
jgi:heme-degrading monooxygenase HmoA